jgi:hypothetical protein
VRGGIRDIVEFKVEENVKTALLQVAYDLRSKQREHLFANFQTAVARVYTVDKGQCRVTFIVIKRNNNRRISIYAGSGGSNRRHDQPFSSMGAQRRGTDKRRAFYLPALQIDRIDLLSCLAGKPHGLNGF